jgi:hypothetical protein
MDRHLIPYLQNLIDFHRKHIIGIKISEYSFSFRNTSEHCDVTISYDSISDCVLINQTFIYEGIETSDEDDISIEGFVKYIS